MNISRFYCSCSVGSKIRCLPEPGRSSEWHQSSAGKWFLSSWRTNTENISTQVWSGGFRTFRTDNLYVTRTRCYFVSHSWKNVNQLKIDDPRSTTLLFKSIWAWTNVAWICSFTGHTVTLDLLQTSGVGCLETHTHAQTHAHAHARWEIQMGLPKMSWGSSSFLLTIPFHSKSETTRFGFNTESNIYEFCFFYIKA